MTRLELHQTQPRQIKWKGPFFFVLTCAIFAAGILFFQHYWDKTIRINAPKEDLGKKVVVQLPNGQEVFTYEKRIFQKDGKTYYKGERNKIDLTGGTISYKNW